MVDGLATGLGCPPPYCAKTAGIDSRVPLRISGLESGWRDVEGGYYLAKHELAYVRTAGTAVVTEAAHLRVCSSAEVILETLPKFPPSLQRPCMSEQRNMNCFQKSYLLHISGLLYSSKFQSDLLQMFIVHRIVNHPSICRVH